jgi:hypothetical protein
MDGVDVTPIALQVELLSVLIISRKSIVADLLF